VEHYACSEALKLVYCHRIGRLFWPILSTIGLW